MALPSWFFSNKLEGPETLTLFRPVEVSSFSSCLAIWLRVKPRLLILAAAASKLVALVAAHKGQKTGFLVPTLETTVLLVAATLDPLPFAVAVVLIAVLSPYKVPNTAAGLVKSLIFSSVVLVLPKLQLKAPQVSATRPTLLTKGPIVLVLRTALVADLVILVRQLPLPLMAHVAVPPFPSPVKEARL